MSKHGWFFKSLPVASPCQLLWRCNTYRARDSLRKCLRMMKFRNTKDYHGILFEIDKKILSRNLMKYERLKDQKIKIRHFKELTKTAKSQMLIINFIALGNSFVKKWCQKIFLITYDCWMLLSKLNLSTASLISLFQIVTE